MPVIIFVVRLFSVLWRIATRASRQVRFIISPHYKFWCKPLCLRTFQARYKGGMFSGVFVQKENWEINSRVFNENRANACRFQNRTRHPHYQRALSLWNQNVWSRGFSFICLISLSLLSRIKFYLKTNNLKTLKLCTCLTPGVIYSTLEAVFVHFPNSCRFSRFF